jgi:hypothetical protein
LLLQAANFRQQRDKQANLLKNQRRFAVARGSRCGSGFEAVHPAPVAPAVHRLGVMKCIIDIADGIIQQGENIRVDSFSRCAPSAEI